jgi:HD superfamily phosphohydrolase
MFDNIYWHHTNRACMVMLLRATQEALIAGALQPNELLGHDDASLLTRLDSAAMPASTQHLARALRDRHIYKRAVEVGSRAFELYARLGNLFFDPLARRDVEIRLAAALSEEIGQAVPPEAVLIDIPKPERWRSDVWVTFDKPRSALTRRCRGGMSWD